MIAKSLEKELFDEIGRLSEPEQRQVLDYARALANGTPQGESGERILSIVGAIPSADLGEMRRAIEEGCERIDAGGW